MKKIIAGLMTVILLISCCMPVALAAEAQSEADSSLEEPIRLVLNDLTCEYDRSSGKIKIRGSVRHETLISHKQYRLEVYRILPGQSETDAITGKQAQPLASAEIAVRFEFSVDAKGNLERFSRYVVVLCSPEGVRTPAAEPQYAGVESDHVYVADDFSSFKGLVSSEISLGGNLGIGTVVVPVYWERLFNEVSHGYVYSSGEQVFYFDKEYVNELDRQIRTYSSSGTRVYLQFLLSANGSGLGYADGSQMGATYDMPNVFAERQLSLICAGTEFLAERYSTYQSGQFYGVIVGHSIDESGMNYCGTLSLERYAELYSLYLTAMAYSVRVHQPEADVVIPFGANQFASAAAGEQTSYTASQLLESILSIQDEAFSFPFRCSTMILCVWEDTDPGKVTIETASVYSQYLNTLRNRFESAPSHYMIRWDVPGSIDSEALCAQYAYGYYRLIQDSNLSSFLVSFSECETKGESRLSELSQILRWIDTDQSLAVTKPLLSHFEATSWDQLIPGCTSRSYSVRTVINPEVGSSVPSDATGSFSYFDFASGNVEDWVVGFGFTSVKSEYGAEGIRVLRGTLASGLGSAYGEMLCLYEYPENFAHTPQLSFRIGLAEAQGDASGLYQVMITLGNDTHRSTGQAIVRGGKIETVVLDMSQFPTGQTVQYLKLSVKQLEGDGQAISVRLYDLIGYSAELTSEELSEVIWEERMAIRNLTSEEEENDGDSRWWIFGIVVSVIAVAVGILFSIRREDDGGEDVPHEKK